MAKRNPKINAAMEIIAEQQRTGRTISNICADSGKIDSVTFYKICRDFDIDRKLKRVKVPLKLVKDLLQKASVWKVSKALGLPESVVKDIQRGKDREWYTPREYMRKKPSKEQPPCSKPGCDNPRKPGNRFLCEYHSEKEAEPGPCWPW